MNLLLYNDKIGAPGAVLSKVPTWGSSTDAETSDAPSVLQLLAPWVPYHRAVAFVWNVSVTYDFSDFARRNVELSKSMI